MIFILAKHSTGLVAHAGTTALDLANTIVICLGVVALVIGVTLVCTWRYHRQDEQD